MMDGKAMSWDDIYNYLDALPDNSSVKISLNGNTTVPAKIAEVIRDKKHTVEFVYDSVKSWVVRGANVGTASVAEFAILPEMRTEARSAACSEQISELAARTFRRS